jgi:hypothetical protein
MESINYTFISIVILVLLILIAIIYLIYLYFSLKPKTEFKFPTTSSTLEISPQPIQPIQTIQPTPESKTFKVPIVKELKFGDIVIPKPPCLYGQIYNDVARKCLCPKSTQALINNKCMEVKCYDGYKTKRSGVNGDGNFIICINENGNEKLILTNNLEPIKISMD